MELRRFAIGFGIPLALAAVALRDRLADVLYWTLTFNVSVYREQAALVRPADVALTLVWVFPALLLTHWTRRMAVWGLAALLAIWIANSPRYGLGHLPMALPFVALLVAAASAQHRKLALAALVLSVAVGSALLAPRARSDGLETTAAWFQAVTDARPGDRVLILGETDAYAAFYALTGTLPAEVWSPAYRWFYAPSTGVEARQHAALGARIPEYVVDLSEQVASNEAVLIPDALLEAAYRHYEPLAAQDGAVILKRR